VAVDYLEGTRIGEPEDSRSHWQVGAVQAQQCPQSILAQQMLPRLYLGGRVNGRPPIFSQQDIAIEFPKHNFIEADLVNGLTGSSIQPFCELRLKFIRLEKAA
jgi:hypothetical protein